MQTFKNSLHQNDVFVVTVQSAQLHCLLQQQQANIFLTCTSYFLVFFTATRVPYTQTFVWNQEHCLSGTIRCHTKGRWHTTLQSTCAGRFIFSNTICSAIQKLNLPIFSKRHICIVVTHVVVVQKIRDLQKKWGKNRQGPTDVRKETPKHVPSAKSLKKHAHRQTENRRNAHTRSRTIRAANL